MSSSKMTTLKGIFPDPKPVRRKNFIQENVKNLRRMEQCFQSNKDMEELQKLQLQRHQKITDKYQNVTAKVHTSFREKKCEDVPRTAPNNKEEENEKNEQKQLQRKPSTPVLVKKQSTPIKKSFQSPTINNPSVKHKKPIRARTNETQRVLQTKVLSDPNLAKKHLENTNDESNELTSYKNQGIQTLDDQEIDKLYAEGVIRYPSKKNRKSSESSSNKDELDHHEIKSNKTKIQTPNPPSDRGDIGPPAEDTENVPQNSVSPHAEVDFIKLNKERTSVANKFATQLNNSVPPLNYRKGVVPKYIRDRKEALQKEQQAKAAASHPDCPEGHIPLPDDERKATLHMLKKNYQEYIHELNMMPIKTDTLRAQRRKIEIEKELNKLEEGIKVFSRPIVFVKINA